MTQPRARFNAELVDHDLIAIVDLDRGDKSVTNDIERVVRLVGEYTTISGRQIIYRDSTGYWDGVRVRAGIFAGFVPIRASRREDAVEAARALIAAGRW